MINLNYQINYGYLKDVCLYLLSDLVLYVNNFVVYFSFWVFCYLLICYILYRKYTSKIHSNTCSLGAIKAKRVLIVTAHPDDECMFFGPTVFRLCENGANVHLLCLSNGDYEGKGDTRQKELWLACEELGLPNENICLISDTRLKDDPNISWVVPVVAKLILHRIESLDIDTLITFDKQGVSLHSNHVSLFYAVAFMFVEKLIPPGCAVYALDSVNILRKYWGFLDLPLSFLLSSKRYFLRWKESRRVVLAMKRHKSQMVWFRRLYVLFSRYMVINTLRRINLTDIELELEVDD